MSFKNLEQRFNERVKQIYAPAKAKFENGRSSRGRNDDPLIVRRPGDGYWNFAESRSLPIISALNDVKRVTLFTASKRGLIFLIKQQLLQTGNTFEQTRLINPLFTIGNAVPFLHLRRNVRPLTGPYGILKRRPSTSYEDIRKIGQLQKSTYDGFDAKGVGGFLKKLLSPITNTVSAFTAKKNVGEHFGYDEKGWVKSRPELGTSDSKYTNAKKLLRPGRAPLGGLLGAFNLGFINSVGKFDQGGGVLTQTFLGQSYGPIAKGGNWNGNYTTYLNFTDGKAKWSHGRAESDYVVARRSGVDVVALKPSTTAEEKNLATRYENSYGLEAIDSQIESDRYVDYGSAERYLGYLTSPEIYNELTDTARRLEAEFYPIVEEKVTERIEEARYLDYGSAERYLSFPSQPEIYTALVTGSRLDLESLAELSTDYYRQEEARIQNIQILIQEQLQKPYEDGNRVQYIKYFSGGEQTLRNASQEEILDGISTNTKKIALTLEGNRQQISYIKDPANEDASEVIQQAQDVRPAYKLINGAVTSFDDPIVVSFAMGNDSSVRFRAFIKDLQQSITPRYNEFQYIGRTERFINYVTAQREVSFKLGVIAFSKDEIDNVWRRINYLTGLAFPYGYNRGIYQPNILRLTIGNVFHNQPGYITSINTSFDQLSEAWDIDREVPISAQMDIRFILIEKKAKLAESPFYGITERGVSGFSDTIQPPTKIEEQPTPEEAPILEPIQVPIQLTTKVETPPPLNNIKVNPTIPIAEPSFDLVSRDLIPINGPGDQQKQTLQSTNDAIEKTSGTPVSIGPLSTLNGPPGSLSNSTGGSGFG